VHTFYQDVFMADARKEMDELYRQIEELKKINAQNEAKIEKLTAEKETQTETIMRYRKLVTELQKTKK
jgi:hypothetical protein